LSVLYKGDVGVGLRRLVREYMSTAGHAVLVAHDGSEILGLLVGSARLDIDWECRAALVDAVVVRETQRRRGIGRALVRQFCTWARERECSVLQVVNPNEEFFGGLGLADRKARFWQSNLDDVRT